MIDETTTRRGFLKGLGAAVALLTVAPSLLLEQVVAETPAVETEYPLRAAGELWLRIRGQWRLIGGVESLSSQREVQEDSFLSLDSVYRHLSYMGPPTLTADLVVDASGAGLIVDTVLDREKVDIAVAFRDCEFEIPQALLTNYETEFKATHHVVRISGSYESSRLCPRWQELE